MLATFLAIVGSQVAIAALLFGSDVIDRPDLAGRARTWARRHQGELPTLRAHQRMLSGLRRATERSIDASVPLETAPTDP
jgi:hypothetical protein